MLQKLGELVPWSPAVRGQYGISCGRYPTWPEALGGSQRAAQAKVYGSVHYHCAPMRTLKRLSHKKIFCVNLIFWIVMGCGMGWFGMRGLKTLKLENGAALRGGSMGLQGCRRDLEGWRISNLKVLRHRTTRGLSDTPIGPMAPPLEVRGFLWDDPLKHRPI